MSFPRCHPPIQRGRPRGPRLRRPRSPIRRGRPRGPRSALGALALVSAMPLCGLAACFGPAAPPEPTAEALLGAWEVANGTRREACPEGVVTAPFTARVWLRGEAGAPLWRTDEGSSCELRFGPWVAAGGAGADLLPGQSCAELTVDADGAVVERRIYPLSWEVRQLDEELLWERYDVHVIERRGKVERVCRVSAAATLARPGPAAR